MNRFEEASARQMRQAAGIVVVGLVRREQLQCLMRLPALDADNWQCELVQTMLQHRRHSAGLEYDPPTGWNLGELGCNGRRRRRHLRLVDDSAALPDNANLRLRHRDIQPGKILHCRSPLPVTKLILSASAEEPRPLPDVEKPLDSGGTIERRARSD
jgi:hypothetical protein